MEIVNRFFSLPLLNGLSRDPEFHKSSREMCYDLSNQVCFLLMLGTGQIYNTPLSICFPSFLSSLLFLYSSFLGIVTLIHHFMYVLPRALFLENVGLEKMYSKNKTKHIAVVGERECECAHFNIPPYFLIRYIQLQT